MDTNIAFGPQMTTSENNNDGVRTEVVVPAIEPTRPLETGQGSNAHSEEGTHSLLAQLLAKMVNQEKDKDVSHVDFLKLQPPVYNGSEDPSRAEQWIRQMDRIFSLFRKQVTSAEKVDLAVYMLRGDAVTWWESVRARYLEEQVLTWEEFKRLFLAKYFPVVLRNRLERQFMDLTQGNLSVVKYENEFNHLSQYAPSLIADEDTKARRFTDGLIPPI